MITTKNMNHRITDRHIILNCSKANEGAKLTDGEIIQNVPSARVIVYDAKFQTDHASLNIQFICRETNIVMYSVRERIKKADAAAIKAHVIACGWNTEMSNIRQLSASEGKI